jgi:enoyl-CoA hydratase
MDRFVLTDRVGSVGLITLNRPEVLNAWHRDMRLQLVAALEGFERDNDIRAIILTGTGDRAFSAGQDLNETKTFDADQGGEWVKEWERLYETIRSLSKPLIAALNGVAAGSAFQVALLTDFRVGHPGVRMGQPEINSGIASTTGPWIMREILGLARTIDLTLTGRLMDAEECRSLGLINRLVPQEKVLDEALALANELAAKPPVAMRLDKQRFREMTEAGFRDCLEAGLRIQRESYASGEPARMMEQFLARRKNKQAS